MQCRAIHDCLRLYDLQLSKWSTARAYSAGGPRHEPATRCVQRRRWPPGTRFETRPGLSRGREVPRCGTWADDAGRANLWEFCVNGPPKVAIGLLWHDRARERRCPRRSWAHPARERQAPARFLLPARLRPLGALVLSCVPRGERAVGRRYRDDAPLGHPVVWQVDDIPLPVVLVFDDQRNRSHAVDCNCFVRERSDHPRFGVTRAHLTVPSRAIAGTGRRFAPSRDRMCGLTECSRPTPSRPASGSLPR